jgi:hypothetical protein
MEPSGSRPFSATWSDTSQPPKYLGLGLATTTTVPATTTTIGIDVAGSGETLPETGLADDVESAVPWGFALLLFGRTLVAASREVRVSWKT